MCDIFGEAKRRLAREIDSNSALLSEPIAADPWVISSLLQKSIRRGARGVPLSLCSNTEARPSGAV
jgi:hypothetical protein